MASRTFRRLYISCRKCTIDQSIVQNTNFLKFTGKSHIDFGWISYVFYIHLKGLRCKYGIERKREMFHLTTHSTHFIYGYMASDIWLRTILIVRKETCCRHIGYSFRLAARVLLYAPSHRQDNTYHGLCYTSRGALAGTRNSSMGPPHEGSI